MFDVATEAERSVRLLYPPGAVIELRALDVDGDQTAFGYYADPRRLAEDAARLSGRAREVYVSSSHVGPDFLDRGLFTRKGQAWDGWGISRRRWLLIDCDSVDRGDGPATDQELEATRELADQARNWLRAHGWPDPVVACSGNGYHLLYRVDLPAGDCESVRQAFEEIAKRFPAPNAPGTAIGVAHTPHRLTKLYGCQVRKGEATPDRPYRHSRILEVPEEIEIVTEAQLRAIADPVPSPAMPDNAAEVTVERAGVRVLGALQMLASAAPDMLRLPAAHAQLEAAARDVALLIQHAIREPASADARQDQRAAPVASPLPHTRGSRA